MGIQFPSPLGVSYFQIMKKEYMKPFEEFEAKFPSPLGVSYFQIQSDLHNYQFNVKKFPSPLGVSYFQIISNIESGMFRMNSFRPLSGYLISKLSFHTP